MPGPEGGIATPPRADLLHRDDPRLYPQVVFPPKHEIEALPPYEVRPLNPLVLEGIVAWVNPNVIDVIDKWQRPTIVHHSAEQSKANPDPYGRMMTIHTWAHQENLDEARYTQERRGLPASWTEEVRQHFNILFQILKWGSDQETRLHLDPPPPLYTPFDPDLLAPAVSDLTLYYLNFEEENDRQIITPKKITPLIGFDEDGKPQGVLTIRWRGDPWIDPLENTTAGIERIMVDKDFRGNKLGKKMLRTAEELARARAYTNLRAWVMIGRRYGRFDKPYNLFSGEGYVPYRGNDPALYSEYCRKRNIPYSEAKDGEALWLDKDLMR